MVLVHEPGRRGHHGWEGADGRGSPLLSVARNIELYERMAGAVSPSRVAAIALNTGQLPEADARAEIARLATETGLPVDDPYRFGPHDLFARLRGSLEDGR